MSRWLASKFLVCALLTGVLGEAAGAANVDAGTGFKWDVSRELAVMQQSPQAITAAVRPGAHMPQVSIGTLYSLTLADQAGVMFAAGPAKVSGVPGAHAGLVRFAVKKAGRYRISITSGHWVDVVDGVQLLPAVDYQGHVGCERPRKIVEFDVPAQHTLTLQFSGSSDPETVVAITAVSTAS
jgi:hypothetical protein